jgi:hypothetical protein
MMLGALTPPLVRRSRARTLATSARGEGGEHDNGHIALAAQDATDFAPVHVGEHEVQDNKIRFLAAGSDQGGLTVRGAHDAEAVLLQIIPREADDLGFVIYNKDEFLHGSSLPNGFL